MAAQLTVNLLESYLSWTMVKRSSNILVHHMRGREICTIRERKWERGESCTAQEGEEVFEHCNVYSSLSYSPAQLKQMICFILWPRLIGEVLLNRWHQTIIVHLAHIWQSCDCPGLLHFQFCMQKLKAWKGWEWTTSHDHHMTSHDQHMIITWPHTISTW